jgi:hypothetical protein
MATYYVRTPANGGNDGNAGTSTTTAWATFTKAFSASGFTSGDTVYVEPGVYRETVTALNTSPTTRAFVIGDYNGAIFGTSGEVRWTSYTTNDDTAGTTTTLFSLNGRDNITIRGIRFEANGRAIDVTTGSRFIDIEDCVIVGQGAGCIALTGSADLSIGANIRRCIVHGIQDSILVTPNLSSNNVNAAVNIENCVVTARTNRAIYFSSSGTNAVASGCTVKNCTVSGPTGIATIASRYAASGVTVTNCLVYLCTAGISGGSAGSIGVTYTRTAMCATALTNTTGTTGNSTGNASIDNGASFLYDLNPRRPWYMPYVTGIINGDGTPTGMPTDDIHGTTRPNPPAIGVSEITTLYSTGGGMKVHPGMTGGIRG